MQFKRGDTFILEGQLSPKQNGVLIEDLTGWTGAAQLRKPDGTLIANLVFEWVNAATRTARIRAVGSTQTWPDGLDMDIQLTNPDASVVLSTATAKITVLNDVTF